MSDLDQILLAWRGNCSCGKWLVVLRTYTEDKPLRCEGPCGSTTGCGALWYWEGDVLREVRP